MGLRLLELLVAHPKLVHRAVRGARAALENVSEEVRVDPWFPGLLTEYYWALQVCRSLGQAGQLDCTQVASESLTL